MKNDNSYEFWLNYYRKDFRELCTTMMHDYNNVLVNNYNDLKKNYENRNDKFSTNIVIKDSLNGHLNQIKALEYILKVNS